MFTTFSGSLDDRLAALDLPPEVSQQLEDEKIKLGAAEAPEGLDAALGAAVERAIDEAFVSGYRVVMLVAAVMAIASALSATILIEGKKPQVGIGEARGRRARAPAPLDALSRGSTRSIEKGVTSE